MIPALDPETHRLPFSAPDAPIVASLEEIAERFVASAPGRPRRERVWDAFMLWKDLADEALPGATFWLSGSFLTDRERPSDLDVVAVLEPHHTSELRPLVTDRVRVLLTHLNLLAEQPAGLAPRLQPVGGLIDGFACYGWVPENVSWWQDAWSTEYDKTTHEPTGVRMGYVEVTP